MLILSLDTSCDETSAALTDCQRVISHVEYSQVPIHSKWGGVVPSLAKRAHEEKIDWVIEKLFKRSKQRLKIEDVNAIAVTVGPGLAIALEVAINKAKILASYYDKPLIPVNHMSGHIYSGFVQNSQGNPDRQFNFPYLALLVSGGHTELVIFHSHDNFEVIGQTRDDAIGESLDKAARMLGFGYPGGPVIEKMAEEVHNQDIYKFTRPMMKSHDLDFSYAGLKTAFLYFTKNMGEDKLLNEVKNLASSYQEAAFGSITKKVDLAIKKTRINRLVVGGGVAVNKRLRYLLKNLVRKHGGTVFFPSYKYLNFDNAAMIGVVANYIDSKKYVVRKAIDNVDRLPRMKLSQ